MPSSTISGRGEAAPPATDYSKANALLVFYADTLDDIEATVIANENRHRSLTMAAEDGGKGWEPDSDMALTLREEVIDPLRMIEADVIRKLEKAMRQHPLGVFVKGTSGLGLKQTGRLLASIGDPLWNDTEQRSRTVSELWQFCGHGDPGRSHRNSENVRYDDDGRPRLAYNPTAKMRVHLVAESCMKARTSPYRVVYDRAREKYAAAIHASDCNRCGPQGHPAPAGSPLSDGHKHARALRAVGKAVLRDLYRVARGQSPMFR